MRIPTFLAIRILLISVICASCAATPASAPPDRVLFVGNSLTYVGNVPALFSALAEANGRPAASDMIVVGGATLSERAADGSVAEALAETAYAALVLQERGGDATCSFGPDSCVQSRQAIRHLADLGRANGVRVVLLGTYQPHPLASARLVEAESSAAAEAGIEYIQVSETLQWLLGSAPGLTWFADDGSHPGKDLALLNAILVHKTLRGALPEVAPLTVRAPIYGTTTGLTQTLRRADAPPPLPDTPGQVRYPSDVLAILVDAASDGSDR